MTKTLCFFTNAVVVESRFAVYYIDLAVGLVFFALISVQLFDGTLDMRTNYPLPVSYTHLTLPTILRV